MTRALRVGTRGSPLALAQTAEAMARIRAAHPDCPLETVVIRTHGDEGSPPEPGVALDGKRAFTKRIDDALVKGEIDLAVHSLKDVPTDATEGVVIAAVPPRADPRDVLVARDGVSPSNLPAGTRVGTSSLRRRAQLLAAWPDLTILELHGNVGTRLRRLDAKDFDALVVAAAGLDRLQLRERNVDAFDPAVVTPAPGQGALAVECRREDTATRRLLTAVDDPSTRRAVEAERAVSARLGGGCNVPFGALANLDRGTMTLRAVVASVDGRRLVRAEAGGPAAGWRALADSVSASLLDKGGRAILKEAA